MILDGQFTIPAPQQRVWDAIWDVPTMASWVPGCTAAERIDASAYRVHLEQQVGLFKAAFDLRLTVVETEPPGRIILHGVGEDPRMASHLQFRSEITLIPDGANATTLRYRHDLSMLGRLGALGFPLIQRRAREIETEFARRATVLLAGG